MRMRAAGPPGKMSPVNRLGKKKQRNHLSPQTGRGYDGLKITDSGNAGIGEDAKIGVCCRCNRVRLVGPLSFSPDKRWCVGGCKKKK